MEVKDYMGLPYTRLVQEISFLTIFPQPAALLRTCRPELPCVANYFRPKGFLKSSYTFSTG